MFEVVGQFFDVVGSDGARVAEIHEGNPISDATWKKLRVSIREFLLYVRKGENYVRKTSFLHFFTFKPGLFFHRFLLNSRRSKVKNFC